MPRELHRKPRPFPMPPRAVDPLVCTVVSARSNEVNKWAEAAGVAWVTGEWGGPASLAGCRRHKTPLHRSASSAKRLLSGAASCRCATQPLIAGENLVPRPELGAVFQARLRGDRASSRSHVRQNVGRSLTPRSGERGYRPENRPSERADVSLPCRIEGGLTPPVTLQSDRGCDRLSCVAPPTYVWGSLTVCQRESIGTLRS